MADLRPFGHGDARGDRRAGGPGRSDRAQIILVGAFALAVVFVALALVMNAAIYTENLATRSETAGTADAHAFQRATSTTAEDAFRYAHEVNDSDHAGLEKNVTQAMTAYYNVTRTQQATNGRLTDVTVSSTTRGTNISDDSGDFQSEFDDDDWTLANGVSDTRRFRVDVDNWNGPVDEEFRVVAGDVTNWYLNVSYDGTDYEIGVNDSGVYDTCATTGTAAISIDFSDGTVNGSPCSALDLHEVSGSYDLQFENGSVASGEYSVIVDAEESYGSADSDDPTTEDVLYSMEVDLAYWTPELRYESTIRVAPGEYDG
ncbi:DUF7261 family protein [Halosimplex salinum]|uniref:DUF7261 family protein n=1 Tax=Halosimplex salinum TaxID=1710538 RepID=UPI000F4ADA9C|nr:hypothetical protein [Halosimplex salinum]